MNATLLLPPLAGRVGHASTSHAMIQGFACHARGVEIVVSTPAHVHARVRSKRTHDVHFRVDGRRLLVSCSCPAPTIAAAICKHAWAALLEVDRRSALESLRTLQGPVSVEPAAPEPPKKKRQRT